MMLLGNSTNLDVLAHELKLEMGLSLILFEISKANLEHSAFETVRSKFYKNTKNQLETHCNKL